GGRFLASSAYRSRVATREECFPADSGANGVSVRLFPPSRLERSGFALSQLGTPSVAPPRSAPESGSCGSCNGSDASEKPCQKPEPRSSWFSGSSRFRPARIVEDPSGAASQLGSGAGVGLVSRPGPKFSSSCVDPRERRKRRGWTQSPCFDGS